MSKAFGTAADTDQSIEANILREIANWTPEAKAKAYAALEKRTSGERQVWYCASPGRMCDGKPHDKYPYPHARADQWPPPGVDWFVWLIMSGRGSGKTRTGAEWCRLISGKVPQMALIGRRGTDVRGTMVEGPSGLIKACENAGVTYDWMPSKKEFTFANGAKAFGYSAEEPDSLRGPQHGATWLDEPAHMPLIEDVWDNLLFGLRMPGLPGGAKALCTSTPLPGKWLKERIKERTTRLVRVSTYANIDNLDPTFARQILERYEGTRTGRQELDGELLEDTPGALWSDSMFLRPDILRLKQDFDRIVVAIDPAGTNNRRSDETGIIVLGSIGKNGYVLEDLSGKYSPNGWAEMATKAYERWEADAIIAEKNFGGDMVKSTIQNTGSRARIIITTATRSKALRAEPVVALYERNSVPGASKMYHNGKFPLLEEEMLSWVPGVGDSPNRVDALVWGFTELLHAGGGVTIASALGARLQTGDSGLNPITRMLRR